MASMPFFTLEVFAVQKFQEAIITATYMSHKALSRSTSGRLALFFEIIREG